MSAPTRLLVEGALGREARNLLLASIVEEPSESLQERVWVGTAGALGLAAAAGGSAVGGLGSAASVPPADPGALATLVQGAGASVSAPVAAVAAAGAKLTAIKVVAVAVIGTSVSLGGYRAVEHMAESASSTSETSTRDEGSSTVRLAPAVQAPVAAAPDLAEATGPEEIDLDSPVQGSVADTAKTGSMRAEVVAPASAKRVAEAPAAMDEMDEEKEDVSAEPPVGSTLLEESAMLGQARDALRNGKGSTAMSLLEESFLLYPSSPLSVEREMLFIEAAAAMGRVSLASERAKRLIRANPTGPMVERARRFVREGSIRE